MEYPGFPNALAGGVLIGLGAVLLLLLDGRIAGISGILGGVLRKRDEELGWRVAFVAGLMAGAGAYAAFAERVMVSLVVPLPWLVLGGLLVGFGTRLGGGCTSGHGVCGIGRLSARSVVATATFMTTGALTVLLVRQVLGQ